MKVCKKDKVVLLGNGYSEEDIEQIGEAMTKTVYTIKDKYGEKKRISREKAREILGDEEYLSGISRSAFHWNCMREKEGNKVYFDSSKLFK